jgi:hypothetical protein
VPAPAPTPAPVVESDAAVTAVVPTEETEPAPIVVKVEPREVEKPKLEPVAKALDVSLKAQPITPFRQAMNIMSEGVGSTSILEEVEHNTLQTTFKGTSFVLSAGFLTWALRGASLLASVAATLPAWQGFDPLPVLAAKKRKEKKDEDVDDGNETKDNDWQEKRVQRLLDPINTADEE